MDYQIIKLRFLSSVHFGTGGLAKVQRTICADTVFSALCIEAVKMGCLDELVSAVKEDAIRISDGLPYIGSTLYIPKPLTKVESDQTGESIVKKAAKKLEFIPVNRINTYVSGKLPIVEEEQKFRDGFGEERMIEKAAVFEGKDAEPYAVGIYTFAKTSGLYIILGYKNRGHYELISSLIESLSYSGLGGKRSSGYGRFESFVSKMEPEMLERLNGENYKEYESLSVSFPEDEEADQVIEEASYRLIRRSGFVYSEKYSDTYRKKRDCYLIAAGAVFGTRFSGALLDVSDHGSHPVYRYAKPILLGVR